MGHCPAHRGLEREIAAIDHVAQGDCREEAQDLAAERRPQLVGDAFLAIDAAIDGIALAAGHLKRFVDRLDDLGNPDVVGLAGQGVAAPRPAGALDQICTPEFSEKLLQIPRLIPWRWATSPNGTGLPVAFKAISAIAITA